MRKPLTHTQMIWTHGLDLLTTVPSPYIKDMVSTSVISTRVSPCICEPGLMLLTLHKLQYHNCEPGLMLLTLHKLQYHNCEPGLMLLTLHKLQYHNYCEPGFSVCVCVTRIQIAMSQGFGSGAPWLPIPNVVYVPGALFSIDEDITQYVSHRP